jgi:2-keto-4-pentenoate hydratase/2-oxohepta-3-ene-1,7-dioic acid hydratase in catechol pathway
MNYADHCTEQNLPIPVEPVVFNKFATSLCGNGDAVIIPHESKEFDYEVELAVVIGKKARRVTKEDAYNYVAGYTVAHDVSARDWQLKKNGGQWLLGKAADTYAPIGPAIVTPDEIPNINNLKLKTIVNGEVMQEGNTKELVHDVAACIAWVSKFITLVPGDLILTGTPPGVGCFRKPPFWLKDGDVVTVEIEHLGAITNPIVAEKN